MTSTELLEIIGAVKDKYILEAHSDAAPQRKRLPFKKTLLIAAIIALMLLLVGCTVVVVLRLQDMSLGKHSIDMGNGETVSREFISLQGYAGSPGYLATKEWFEFTDNYDQNQALLNLSAYDDYVEPEEYRVYACYTQEMVDKVDEILEKYHLKMPKRRYSDISHQEIFDAVGIGSIFSAGIEADIFLYEGCYFDDGTFDLGGSITLTGEKTPWPYETGFHYLCMMKNTFYDIRGSVGDIESYEQWNYMTPGGLEVLLALGPDNAIIVADKETCFVTVTIFGAVASEQPMDRAALETLVNTFDFSYSPHAVDIEIADQLEAQRQAEFASSVEAVKQQGRRESYAEFFANYINTEVGVFYSLLDLNGDGIEELAYYFDNSYRELFTIKDGYVEKIHEGGYAFAYGYSICMDENGEYVFEAGKHVGEQNYVSYLSADGLDLRYEAYLKFDSVSNPENPWFVCTNAPGNEVYEFLEIPMTWEPVTLEKFSSIRGSYPVQYLPLYPISDLISPPDAKEESVPDQITIGQSSLDDVAAYYQQQFPDKQVQSYLHDFDGNGYGDLAIWYDGAFRALYLTDETATVKAEYLLENGFALYETYYPLANQVGYEGNILGITEKQDGVEYHKFFSVMSHLYLRECLKYDPDGTDSKWFRAVTESWDTPYDAEITQWQAITEETYQESLNAYQAQPYNLKQISEYYLR